MNTEEKTREQLIAELESLRRVFAESKKAETECRWIEAALRESEERYKGLLESITDYIYTVKVENGRPVSTTHGPGCLAITGYTSEYFQIYPHIWYEMIHEEDRESVLKQVGKILSGEVVQPLEHRIIHKDGSILWVRNTIVPHFDKDGKLIAYNGIVEDITERRMAAEKLSESEEKFRTIAVSARDAIIMMDEKAHVSYWNPSAERIFGYSKVEAIGKGLHELIVPIGQYEGFSEGFEMFRKTGEGPVIGKTLELASVRKDGTEFYAEHSISAVKVKGKWNAIGIVRDVSDRKKAEEALRESFANQERAKKEWEATFDSISDPLFIHDREFKVVRANMAYAEAAGMEFKEFIERPYYEVFPKMDGPFKMCMKAREMQEEEEEFSCPVTNRVFKVRFYPINENGGLLYSIHILEDITEAKRAAERLKEEVDVTTHLLMIAEVTAHITDADRLMEQVVHCGNEILRCDICLSYIWDSETRAFRPSHTFGLSHNMTPMFRTESLDMKAGFVKEAMKKKVPVIIFDPTRTLHPLPEGEGKIKAPSPLWGEGWGEGMFSWLPDIHTLAVIPLLSKKGPLGLIVGVYLKTTPHLHPLPMRGEEIKGGHPLPEGEGQFSYRNMKIMQGIMNQVSVALEQARLYKESVDKALELSHKIETIKVMNQIDRSILSTLKADELLETVTRLISKLIPCERATVSIVDMERGGLIYKAGYGTAVVPKGAFTPFADTSTRVVFETSRTECVNNLSEMTPLLPIEKRLLDEGFLSHIRVPITIKGDVAGILTVGAKRVAAFTKENLSTLEYLCSQIGVALSNARLISDLEELFISVVKSLSSAIDAKSPWTAGHSERVTKYALQIGKEMGLPEKELKDLELAGLLHDVGKIGTYETILDKPAKLDDKELAVMRLHPAKGAEILAPIKQLKDIIPGVKYHHEFYDGTGYPEGLKGEGIPLHARILTVADTVDAMGADRPYRDGRAMDVIIAELKRCSGTQFDPNVVEAFLKGLSQKDIV